MPLRMPHEPILASPLNRPIPVTWAVEAKWDGYRALLAHRRGGSIEIRSRRGTDMTRAFPDLAGDAWTDLPPDTLLDGEIVIWHEGRLAFELLGHRLNRTPAAAMRLATETPAHYVAFDLLYLEGANLMQRPQRERREALKWLFHDRRLAPPWTLCPATTADDLDTIRTWLSWAPAGIEGVVAKNPAQRYLPGRRAGGWGKVRVRNSSEAIPAGVTGSLRNPSSILLGRYDTAGRLRYTGRTTPLPPTARAELAPLLTPAVGDHPWTGRRFSAGWGTKDLLDVTLVAPEVVAEISADVALDAAGRWRHPVRYLRPRPDLAPSDVDLFDGTPSP